MKQCLCHDLIDKTLFETIFDHPIRDYERSGIFRSKLELEKCFRDCFCTSSAEYVEIIFFHETSLSSGQSSNELYT